MDEGRPCDSLDSDAAVIVRSFAEPDAFGVLVERYAPDLHRYVRRRIGPAAVEDVVADVLLTAFVQRRGYDADRADAAPWLFGIAANLVRRHHRKEARAFRALARSGIDPIAEPETDRVDDIVTAEDAARRTAAALARLPRRHRDVLLLVAWADLSYAQVAEALAIPVGTVRSRLSRARRAIRAAFGGTDPRTVTEEIHRG